MSMLLIGGLAIAGGIVLKKIFGGSTSSCNQTPPVSNGYNCGGGKTASGHVNQKSQSCNAGSTRSGSSSHAKAQARATSPVPAAGGWLNNCSGTAASGGSGPVTLYDEKGNPVKVGEADELASGGEGMVYRCPNCPKFVIKVYQDRILNNPVKRKAIERRLKDMVAITDLCQNDAFAWPRMLVYDQNHHVKGFVMRAVKGRSLVTLQGQKQISKYFPGWNREDLAIVADDFLEKMHVLAKYGVLVNDFNPRNFIVGSDHKVRFIDCDSFQIPSADGGTPHIATSYFASHVAPEILQNPELLNGPRNESQANFAAAIIVFQLLMCGLHPYSHKNGGTPEDNLKSGKCPLGLKSGAQLPLGWYNLLSYFPYTLTDTFIRMFRDGHGNPSVRPSLKNLKIEVVKFLSVMRKDPVRRELNPSSAKTKSKTASDTYEKKYA